MPRDIAALYSYTRNHSIKLALNLFVWAADCNGPSPLGRTSFSYPLADFSWLMTLTWGVVFFFLFPLILRIPTTEATSTLSIQPDKLSTQIVKRSDDVPGQRWIACMSPMSTFF
jgi:hypothetical protein